MSKHRYTYNLRFLIIAILLWELIFWGLYYVLISSLGLFTVETNAERMMYKNPAILNALFLLIPLIGLFLYNASKNNKIASSTSSSNALQSYLTPVSTTNSYVRYFLFRNAFVLLIIAMGQPVFGKKKVAATVDDLELVVCLDISNSMNTRDISKTMSRLEISKRALTQMVNNLHGERIGICLFANNAFVQLPITRDYSAAKLFIKDIQTNMISSQGTNINAALEVATEMFSKEKTVKGIIMVTDGENHESDPSKILAKIKKEKIQLSVLGIGTKKGGLIPKKPNRPELGYKTAANGRNIRSKLNEAFIKDIAVKGGGSASISSNEFPDLSGLLTQINKMKRTKIDTLEFDIKQERYGIPLFISLLFWMTFLLWSKRYVGLLDTFIRTK